MNIFSLLRVIAVDVLSYWIDKIDLIHLDSAFCNSTSRDLLLAMFEKEYFTMGKNSFSTDCLKYVNIRKLKLKILSLNDDFGSRKLIHKLVVSKVRCLKIVGCRQWKLPRADLVSLFNACVMLRELKLIDVQSCHDDVILQFNPIILNQLTRLSITVDAENQFSSNSVQHFVDHCHFLNSVQFNFIGHRISFIQIHKLVDVNPQLMDLNLSWKPQSYDSDFLIGWACKQINQVTGMSFDVSINVRDGSHKTLNVTGVSSSAQIKNKSVTVISRKYNGSDAPEILALFTDLTSLYVGNIYLTLRYTPVLLPTIVSRNPNLTSLTAQLVYLPEDTRYLYDRFPKLVNFTCVGDHYKPHFTIRPMTSDCEGFKLKLIGCEIYKFQTGFMLSQLVHAIPRLKQVSMSNIRRADRPDIVTACKARGAELVWN